MAQFLEKLARIFLFASLAAPIISSQAFVFPYIAPSMFYFEFCTLLSLLAYLLLLLWNPEKRPYWNRCTLAVAIFFLAQGLLVFFSVDPLRSFYGSVERMTGVWNLLHLFFFFIVAVSLFRDKKEQQQLVKFSLLIAGIAAMQYLIAATGNFLSLGKYALGNPGFLANYLVLHIPFALWLSKESTSRETKIGLGMLIAFFSILTIWIGNRAAFLGLVVLFFCLAGYAVLQKPRARVAVITAVASFLLIFSALLSQRNAEFVKKSDFLSKITNWSLTDKSIRSRLLMWPMGFQGFRDRPLGGWGRENFGQIFEKYYSQEFYGVNDDESWSDRAHNIFIDELATGGLINAAAWLILLSAFAIALFTGWRKNRLFAILFGSFFLSYFAQLFFTLDTLGTYLPLFLAFFLLSIHAEKSPAAMGRTNLRIAMGALAAWLFVSSYFFTAIPLVANYQTGRAFFAMGMNLFEYRARNAIVDKLLPDTNPWKIELIATQARGLKDLSRYFGGPQFLLYPFQDELIKKLEVLHALRPHDVKISTLLALHTYSKGYQLREPDAIKRAVELWDQLIIEYPNRIPFYGFASLAYLLEGNVQRAVELAETADRLAPGKHLTYQLMGQVYTANHNDQKAVVAFTKSLSLALNERVHKIIEITNLANSLAKNEKRYELARDLYKLVLQYNPLNADLHANLAYVYKELGDKANARKEAEEARKLSPQHSKEIDEFLRKL